MHLRENEIALNATNLGNEKQLQRGMLGSDPNEKLHCVVLLVIYASKDDGRSINTSKQLIIMTHFLNRFQKSFGIVFMSSGSVQANGRERTFWHTRYLSINIL